MTWDSFFLVALPALVTGAAFFILQVVEAKTARLSPAVKDGQHVVRVALVQRLFFYFLALCMLALLTLITAAWVFRWGTPDVEIGLVLVLGLFVISVSYGLLWVGTRSYSWDDAVVRIGTDVSLTRTFHWSKLTSIDRDKLKLGYRLGFGDDGVLRVKTNSVGAALLVETAKKKRATPAR